MDKIERYRQFIKQILTEHAQITANTDTIKPELIFDNENDHYQLAYVGWQGDKRVFGPVISCSVNYLRLSSDFNPPMKTG